MNESIWTAESVKKETPNIMVKLANEKLIEAEVELTESGNWVRIKCAGCAHFYLFPADVARSLNENKPVHQPFGRH